jgi:hypothetical protein
MRDRRLERVEAVIERQQRMAAEGDHQRLFLLAENRQRRSFGPIGASSTVSRLRHFATVFGLIPYRRLSSAIEACDRCIATRTACVVAALPWSIWPIGPP